MKIIYFTQVVEDDAYANNGAYTVVLMTTIWAGGSFLREEKLINQVLSIIPRDCRRTDLVADSHREISWKNSTRAARVEGSFTILKLAKAKIQDTNAFLHENENKCQLIKLFFDWFIDNRRKRLNSLRTTSLYLFVEGYCQRLSISDVSFIGSLVSTHEEVDFRLMVQVKHAIDSNSPVVIRSHSGVTDIFLVILTSFYSANLILTSGTGARRKILQMSDVEVEEDNRNALLVFKPSSGEIIPLQVGKQWTANLVLRKWWQDLVKMTQLMITFVEHLANLFAQCMVVDVQKMSIPFDSTNSLRSRTEKINMWTCLPCSLAKSL